MTNRHVLFAEQISHLETEFLSRGHKVKVVLFFKKRIYTRSIFKFMDDFSNFYDLISNIVLMIFERESRVRGVRGIYMK